MQGKQFRERVEMWVWVKGVRAKSGINRIKEYTVKHKGTFSQKV